MNTRLREMAGRVVPYFQIGLYKTARFVRSNRWLPGVLVSFVIALIIAFSVGWQALGPILDRPSWWMLAAAIFFYFNSIGCRALILRSCMLVQVSYSQSLMNLNEGSLINIIMPLHLGDNGRSFFLARKAGISVYHARSMIRVERLYDAIIVAVMVDISMVISSPDHRLQVLFSWILVILFAFLLSIPFVANRADKLKIYLMGYFESSAGNGKAIIQTKVLSLLDGMTTLSDWRLFGNGLFWSSLSWAFRVVGLYTLILAVSPTARFWAGLFVAGILALSTRIPSAPAGIAVYEGAIILGLSLAGVDPTTALACALISHLIDMLLASILGVVEFFREGETLPGMYKKFVGFN